MNKNTKKLNSIAAIVILVTVLILSLPLTGVAQEADRPTFTMEEPATYVTFNSITNNPAVLNSSGDERDFVQISSADIANVDNIHTYTNRQMVDDKDGQEIWALAYIHNNAAENLNLTAKDVIMRFDISKKSEYDSGRYVLPVTGYISSSNANPASVYDDALLTADKSFSISYVQDSAKWAPVDPGAGIAAKPLSDPTADGGALIGDIKGGSRYAGWITFKVKINFDKLDYSLEQSVRLDGQGTEDWKPQIDVKTGDVVNFKLVYNRSGDGTQNNVTLKGALPEGLEYIVGSTRLKNTNYPDNPFVSSLNPDSDTTEKNIVTTSGIQIGDYYGTASAIVTFSARITDAGSSSLKSTAEVITEYDGRKSAEAFVIVNGGGSSAAAEVTGGAVTPVTPVMPVNPFADVKGSDWFIDHVIYVQDQGLMSGTGTAPMVFSPSVPVTRAMAVTVLYNMKGSPDVSGAADTFSDIPAGAWYTDAVKWAAANHIMSGVGGGRFDPDAEITREQTAAILMSYMQDAGIALPVTKEYVFFADEADIADYAKNAMQTLNKLNIINGKGNDIIAPKGQTTRAEFAAILHNFMNAVAEK